MEGPPRGRGQDWKSREWVREAQGRSEAPLCHFVHLISWSLVAAPAHVRELHSGHLVGGHGRAGSVWAQHPLRGSRRQQTQGGGCCPRALLRHPRACPGSAVECGWRGCPPLAPGPAGGPSPPHPPHEWPQPWGKTLLCRTHGSEKRQKPLPPPAPRLLPCCSVVLTGLAEGPLPCAQDGAESCSRERRVGYILRQRGGGRGWQERSLRTVGISLHHLAVHGHGEGQTQDLRDMKGGWAGLQEARSTDLPPSFPDGLHPTSLGVPPQPWQSGPSWPHPRAIPGPAHHRQTGLPGARPRDLPLPQLGSHGFRWRLFHVHITQDFPGGREDHPHPALGSPMTPTHHSHRAGLGPQNKAGLPVPEMSKVTSPGTGP